MHNPIVLTKKSKVKTDFVLQRGGRFRGSKALRRKWELGRQEVME